MKDKRQELLDYCQQQGMTEEQTNKMYYAAFGEMPSVENNFSEPAPAQKKQVSLKNIITLFGAVIMIFVILTIFNSMNSNSAPKIETAESLATRAFVEAKDQISKTLKAPSTAKYPMYENHFVKITKDTEKEAEYIVRTYVDAQNSFGAMIRNNFMIHLRYNKTTKTWYNLGSEFY